LPTQGLPCAHAPHQGGRSQHTVIMMQVENESACWATAGPLAAARVLGKRSRRVDGLSGPQQAHAASRDAGGMGRNGYKPSGHGGGLCSDEWLMSLHAWYVGRYHGKVAEAGKAELNIPMYANACWTQPTRGSGDWPAAAGGSRSRYLARCGASLDHLARTSMSRISRNLCAVFVRESALHPEARMCRKPLLCTRRIRDGWSHRIEDLSVDGQSRSPTSC